MTDFAIGERVQLKRPYAKAIMGKRPNPVNWLDRRGTVDHVRKVWVYIRWDGKKSLEQVSIKAVEKAA